MTNPSPIFAQIPITGGTYNSIAQRLPLVDSAAVMVNMTNGPHHIGVSYDGYYRVSANLQITGVIGSQAVVYIQQISGSQTNLINQYFLDITGNMVVSFENVIYGLVNDQISIYLTVSTNGAVIINPMNSPTYPSQLSAFILD